MVSNPKGGTNVCCECCVFSGRGLCDELITCPEEFYRLWCVVACDLETSWMRRSWPTGGTVAPKTNRQIVQLEPLKLMSCCCRYTRDSRDSPKCLRQKYVIALWVVFPESHRLNFVSLWQMKFFVCFIEGSFQLTDCMQQSPSGEAI